jgi:hypothetical protein
MFAMKGDVLPMKRGVPIALELDQICWSDWTGRS